MKLLSQGAEAKLYLIKNKILKSRTPKIYRHPSLDQKIRTRRTRSEAKILTKAKSVGVNTPTLFHVEKFNLTIEYIKGNRLSQTLSSYSTKKQTSIIKKIATQVSKLHTNNLIHSDLTTSNIILQDKTNKIYLIDFGLSYHSTKIEDKAVDLHLLNQALIAKHNKTSKTLFKIFCETYSAKDSKKILKRLAIVEKRGRYKKSKH